MLYGVMHVSVLPVLGQQAHYLVRPCDQEMVSESILEVMPSLWAESWRAQFSS